MRSATADYARPMLLGWAVGPFGTLLATKKNFEAPYVSAFRHLSPYMPLMLAVIARAGYGIVAGTDVSGQHARDRARTVTETFRGSR